MGKTNFIICDFSDALFYFKNSRISEVFVALTDFPKKATLEKAEDYDQAQLAYGQLSQAFQKQGDTVRALEYQTREIQAYYKTLIWKKNPVTKLNLFLNWISTSYGRNWFQGFVVSFLFAGFSFWALVVSSKEYKIDFNFDFDARLIAAFMKFVNPLRFFDTETLFAAKNQVYLTLSAGSYIIDFLSRVLLAYFYYQTIQAFRRFGRK